MSRSVPSQRAWLDLGSASYHLWLSLGTMKFPISLTVMQGSSRTHFLVLW